jgi:hypothetical protein
VHGVQLRPFRAYFQHGHPIYSPLTVRVMLGSLSEDADAGGAAEYKWQYTSPPFAVAQADALQTLPLPQPVLCVGGVVRLQLCGRAQTQQGDNLFYVCLAHVRALGTPLHGWAAAPEARRLLFDASDVLGRTAVPPAEPESSDDDADSDFGDEEDDA